MPDEDEWDWPTLMYIATVVLNRSEAQFWKMTPRKFRALVDAHIKMNPSGEKKENKNYIDQIF